MSLPRWDGEHVNGRPVTRCQECGSLRYAEDVQYAGEALLGGPSFSYRLGDSVIEDAVRAFLAVNDESDQRSVEWKLRYLKAFGHLRAVVEGSE